MAANSRLVLYGNSVFLAGIKAQLEKTAGLELTSLEAGCPEIVNLIHRDRPHAVVFDLAMGYPDFAVALLHEQPGLLLIGVDPSSNELLILSGRPQQALSFSDLEAVLYKESYTGEETRK